MGDYCIIDGYDHRLVNDFDDERNKTDVCQDEVYAAAHKLCDAEGLKSVIDFGTGSGFKLLKHLGHLQTVGVDEPATVEWLSQMYPDRRWETGFTAITGHDLIVAADVIEHLPKPDVLLYYIKRCAPRYAILSTPNRKNLQEIFWMGPPRNLCHCREWTDDEFLKYLAPWFNVVDFHTPPADDRERSTMYATVTLR